MPDIRRGGFYTIDVRQLGVLPLPGRTIGMSPTGPITQPVIAPGSGGATIATILAQLSQAAGTSASDVTTIDMNVMANYFVKASYGNPPSSQRKLQTLATLFRAMRPDARNVQDQIAASLASLNDWERYLLSRRFTYNGISAEYPDPCPTPSRCKTSVDVLLSDLAAHVAGVMQVQAQNSTSAPIKTPASGGAWGATIPNAGSLRLGPSSGGIGPSTSSPADRVIQSGGSGAQASSAQTQAVLDANNGSGITTVVPTTGPTESIPGYSPITTIDDSSAAVVSGLPSWWKPALAIALGAALGVGIGRAVAG